MTTTQTCFPGERMPEKVKDILVIVAVVVLAVAAYASTLTHELVWDDIEIVKYIDSIVQEGGLSALVTSQFSTHIEEGYVSGYYRPVTVVSLWFDSMLSGYFPYFYHLTNIFLHALNTILVFVLLRLLNIRFAAAVGSMIFAVHPVHSESVSFVSGRTDLWAAFFVLLAVITWVRERKGLSKTPARDRFWSLGAFFMASLSKEVAFMLPAVLLIWEAVTPGFRQAGQHGWWSRNRRWILGWAAAFACVLALRFLVFGPDLGLVQSRAGQVGSGESAFSLPLIGKMLLVYLRLLVLPWPLRAYYGPAELQITVAVVLGVILFLSLALYTFFRCGKDCAVQGVAWIVLFLVPVLGVAARGGALLAERFLYLPSVGLSLLVGAIATGLTVNRRVGTAVIGLMVALMMVGSVKQSAVWRNEITLFKELVKVSPMTPGGHYNLGNAYSARGMQLDAIRAYRRVVGIDSGYYRAYFNLGNSLAALGRYDDAVEAFREALRIKPDLIPGYVNLGFVLMKRGKFEESAALYREGIRYAPGDARLHLGLTLAYLKAGDRQAAHDHQRVLERENRALAEIINRSLLEGEGEN